MTSERVLLGRNENVQIEEENFFSNIKPRRTSKSQKWLDGFSEPTATIVWSTLLRLDLQPGQFVLWNAFSWHSFDPRRGMLSNRTPTKAEQSTGSMVLRAFLDLFPCDKVVALGRIATAQLKDLAVDASRVHGIRHPASGRREAFSSANREDREQIGLTKLLFSQFEQDRLYRVGNRNAS
jgi:hypothetical protein